jgi:hypothetical protein
MKLPGSKRKNSDPRPSDIIAIQEALRGPVVDVLVDCVPQLSGMPRDAVYDTIMDNPRLADACFKLFRGQRARFDEVVKRPDGSPVADDNELMTCGRTLAEAVTLVVRAIAKRYFLTFDRTLAPRRSAPPRPPRTSLGVRLAAALGLKARPNGNRQAKSSRAEELYRVFREFLIYEWQVPLIPHYAPLPLSVVTAVGPLLLLLREPAQIEALSKIRLGAFEPAVEKGRRRKQVDLEEPSFYPPPNVNGR